MIVLLLGAALAADWPMLQGTEGDPEAPAVRPWGFTQALAEAVPFTSTSFSIRRARAGLRGAVPGTEGAVAWMLAAELGHNALTRVDPAVLTDASVTFSYLPGARVRAGQFKLPLGEEALEMNPLAAEFVNTSLASSQLLLESRIVDGRYVSGASAFRDVGVQAFETFEVGAGELSYALMLSNGRMGGVDLDDGKDVSGRVVWTPWLGGEAGSAAREELGFFVFRLQGPREVDGARALRVRQGAGAKLTRGPWRARAELIHARGVIELAPSAPGEAAAVLADGVAWGGYAFLNRQLGTVAVGARYDELWRGVGDPEALHVFRGLTGDLQVEIQPKVRLMADYELRWGSAPPEGTDPDREARPLADRVSVQAIVIF